MAVIYGPILEAIKVLFTTKNLNFKRKSTIATNIYQPGYVSVIYRSMSKPLVNVDL